MKPLQPGSLSARPQARFYVVISFVGGTIRNTSLILLLIWYAFAAAAAAVDTAKSVWHHPGVSSFVAALKADFADMGASEAELNAQAPPPYKDIAKIQREENRARRKLATERRQRKDPDSSIRAVRHYGRII